MINKIYIACQNKDKAQELSKILETAGFTNVSSWVFGSPDWRVQKTDERKKQIASKCLKDVEIADALVAISPEGRCYGGLWVELGYALGLNKLVILVGKPSNTILYSSLIVQCNDFVGALELLKEF